MSISINQGADLKLRPFKADWEKTNIRVEIPGELINKIVKFALPNVRLQSYSVIAGGCSNLNVRINLNAEQRKILRIYIRDHDSAYREWAITKLIGNSLPVPAINSIAEVEGFYFALCEFKPGITLRELLLSNHRYDIKAVMYQVGEMLTKLQQFIFPMPGFFDNQLKVKHIAGDELILFVKTCLQHKTVKDVLRKDQVNILYQMFDKYEKLLQKIDGNHLVHGDFSPENILVNQINDQWKVSAILDWEFAFSGSILWDVSNMLRYAHQMPKTFESAFESGLQEAGVTLPEGWEKITQLLNVISLLDCLQRSDSSTNPRKCTDIKGLIEYFINVIGY